MAESSTEEGQSIKLELLGSLSLQAHSSDLLPPAALQPKRLALLSYLAIARPRGLHTRDKLIGLFWPELDQERARAALSQTLYVLRGALGNAVFRSRGNDEIGLAPGAVWCDVVAFEEAVANDQPVRALELYRGDLLDGFYVSGAPDFEHWLDGERMRLRQSAQQAAWSLSKAADDADDPALALTWARRAHAFAPQDEAGLRRLMGALDSAGDVAGALQLYDEFEVRLRAEYDAEPSAPTRTVAQFLRKKGPVAPRPAVTAAPPPEPPATLPREVTSAPRRRFALLAAALTFALAAAGLWYAWTVRSGANDRNRVAVMPFVVRGNTSLAYLSDGMVDLLSAKLDGAGPIKTVDPHALLHYVATHRVKTDPDAARAVANRFDAGMFVIGSITEAGGRLQVTATLYDAKARKQASASATAASDADILNAVDALARDLLSSQMREPVSRLARAALTTTESFLALKAYLEGEALYRDGRYEDAFDAYSRAVSLDSTFALAHYRRAIAGDWVDAAGVVNLSLDRARQYAGRLDDRERQLVDALTAYWTATPSEAETRYMTILRTYPDDVDAWYHYGEVQFHWGPVIGRSVAAARPAFERVLTLQPTNSSALAHLARIAALERQPRRLDSLVARYLHTDAGGVRMPEVRLLRAYGTRDTADARHHLRALERSADHNVWVAAWRVAAYTGDPRGALAIIEYNTKPSRPAATRHAAYLSAAHFLAAQGRFADARDELASAALISSERVLETDAFLSAMPFAPDDAAHLTSLRNKLRERRARLSADSAYALARLIMADGLVTARMGQPDSARVLLQSLRQLEAQPGSVGHIDDFIVTLAAAIAFQSGNAQVKREALQLRADWQPRIGQGLVRDPAYTYAAQHFLRAELLRQVGRLDEAAGWYESFGDDFGHDVIFMAPAHLRRGEIHERAGRNAQAVREYQQFIELWSNADSTLQPLVEAARARVRGLR